MSREDLWNRAADAMPAKKSERPEWGTEDYRRYAALFNDITFAPTEQFVFLDTRSAIADYLWAQGWRRDVRPGDVTEQREPA